MRAGPLPASGGPCSRPVRMITRAVLPCGHDQEGDLASALPMQHHGAASDPVWDFSNVTYSF